MPKLPDTVQQEQEGRGFLLDAGVGVGRMSAAPLERVSCLEKGKGRNVSYIFMRALQNPRQQTGNGVFLFGSDCEATPS